MQCPETEEDAYNPIQMCGIALRRPRDWTTIQLLANDLNGGLTESLGKSPGRPSDSLSE